MAEVQVRRFSLAQQLLEECREWLLQEEVANSLLLAVAQRYADQGASVQTGCFAAEVKLGVTRLALGFQAPGRPLFLASPALPEALGPLAEEWARSLTDTSTAASRRIVGEPSSARAFAEKAAEFLPGGHSIHSAHEMQILQILSSPVLKNPVGGTSRLANDDELPLLSRWGVGFARDAGFPDTQEQVAARFSLAVQLGELFVWEDVGEIRSMCLVSQTGAGSSRISAVYTPPAERGQGYGSAIVAEVARKAFAEGAKQVSLYVEKPEVRRLYERIGFSLVGETTEYEIVSG